MSRLLLAGLAIVLGCSPRALAAEVLPRLGDPLEPAVAACLSRTIYPDGHNLPPGRGSVKRGEQVYAQQCAMCHGRTGIEGPSARLAGSDGFISWEDPTRPLRILTHPVLMLSVGAQWPYATSLFDYVRRAMPYYAPKSLSDPDVYAVTGYVLYLNRLLSRDAVLDRQSLPLVRMPGARRTVLAWPDPTR